MSLEKKLSVGVIGATGLVGQRLIHLLNDHPWFDITYVGASPRSAGKPYQEAVAGRWLMKEEIPPQVRTMLVGNVQDVEFAAEQCDLVFSALGMEKQKVRALESIYAESMPVVSNNSAHRQTEDVPVIIPEVNPGHIELISEQQRERGWDRGFIVVKPNCSVQSFIPPIFALMDAGYVVEKLIITTLQAVSGAGYPGVASMDIIDNVIPHISGEEEKTEQEPLKILGTLQHGKINVLDTLTISANCTRVPVTDGHLVNVNLQFGDQKPDLERIKEIWSTFEGPPQQLKLPSAPFPPIVVREEEDRPHVRKDRDAGNGMAVSVGRLRPCSIFDIRFSALSHNTIRGAAGGAILTTELLKAKGYL